MSNSKSNILYVDDEAINLRVFEATLHRNYNVFTVDSGAEGLKILKKESIDLVVSDQRMPEMTGLEFLKKVKSRYPDLKSILLTAYADISVIKEAINDVGIFHYMNKPWVPSQLEVVIENALEFKKLKEEKDSALRELQESEKRFKGLINSAMDAIITVDINGNILMFNPAAEKMFRYKANQVIGESIEMLIPHASRENHLQHLSGFAQSNHKTKYMKSHNNVYGLTCSGEKIPLETSLSKLSLNGQYYFTAIIRDVSEKVRSERDLAESELKFRTLTESSQVAIFILDRSKVVYANRKSEQILGYSSEELKKSDFIQLVHPDDRESVRIFNTKKIDKSVTHTRYNCKMITKDLRTIYLDVSFNVITLKGRRVLLGSCIEITGAVKAHEKMMAAILETQDRERKRIAKELHDGIGQYLTTAKLNFGVLKKEIHECSKNAQEKYQLGLHFLNVSMNESRNMAHDLMPKAVDDFGYVATIESLLQGLKKEVSKVDFQFYTNLRDQRLPPKIEIGFFRITQEAINNILKHSQASVVVIQLMQFSDTLILTIEDNGVGFQLDKVTEIGSFGITSIQNRVKSLGGKCEIGTRPNNGVIISITINK